MSATSQISSFHALIVAGGSGSRFGGNCPKQYARLGNKSALHQCITLFQLFPECQSVRVVIDPQHEALYQNSVKDLKLHRPIFGGSTRKESVYNGLISFIDVKDDEIILIHDAARPCVRPQNIVDLIRAMETYKAATLAVPVNATLRYADDKDKAQELVKRDQLWMIQTPQAFRKGDLLLAHEQAGPLLAYTDDTSLVSELGIDVKLVAGDPQNIKITTPEDMAMAEKLLKRNCVFATGTGFDVHKFRSGSTGPVRLCGVDVPHDVALEGHSDADVGLHALTDALLGAIGDGDIGRHFPPSNPVFKNMDSSIFLKHAADRVAEKAGQIINADITIICETPKITPHAEKMKHRIAEIIGIAAARINIKATTTETLGFTGRGEGIAAQATVSIRLPDDMDE